MYKYIYLCVCIVYIHIIYIYIYIHIYTYMKPGRHTAPRTACLTQFDNAGMLGPLVCCYIVCELKALPHRRLSSPSLLGGCVCVYTRVRRHMCLHEHVLCVPWVCVHILAASCFVLQALARWCVCAKEMAERSCYLLLSGLPSRTILPQILLDIKPAAEHARKTQ